MSSMETISPLRVAAITSVAPLAWGTTYVVTSQLLPPDRPLFAAAVRALPAGLLLLAYHLPGGLAATVQATSPLAVMALAWLMLREPPGPVRIAAALVGLVGVALLVLRSPGTVDAVGLLAAAGSVLVSALGFVLVKRWPAPVDMLTVVSWQLVAGGLVLAVVALLVEGAPPALDLPAVGGFLWLGVVGTALAYQCWFHGLVRMPAGTVSLIGLVNPVVATVLGVLVAHESFGIVPAIGMVLVLGSVIAGQPSVAQRLRRRAQVTEHEPAASSPATRAPAEPAAA